MVQKKEEKRQKCPKDVLDCSLFCGNAENRQNDVFYVLFPKTVYTEGRYLD
jgi:hypothetical protein